MWRLAQVDRERERENEILARCQAAGVPYERYSTFCLHKPLDGRRRAGAEKAAPVALSDAAC
jgi:hypothetical protein